MKFSIIIACYNLGSLVCKAIESCINQEGIKYTDFEILVINDGSKDNTLDYINNYRNQNNIVIIDKPNGGLSNTRNLGIQKAKGDNILFLDGDDWLSSNALLTLSKQQRIYDVIAFPMFYYYNDKNCYPSLLGLQEGEYGRDNFLETTLGKTRFNIIPGQEKLYNRLFLVKNNLYFVEGILHEDNPFFLDVMNCCTSLYYVNEPLYYYRQQRYGSITSTHNINHYKGVINGIFHIDKLQIESNPNVRYLNGNMLVYQITQNYNNHEEALFVYREMRSKRIKQRLLKYIFTESFHFKHTIRMFLLIIDPILLKLFYKSE